MNRAGKYHKWVEWSAEDDVYVGKCSDVITGIHGDDPVMLYRDLCQMVEEVVEERPAQGKPLPETRIRPMMGVL